MDARRSSPLNPPLLLSLLLGVVFVAFPQSFAFAQGAMTNGANHEGSISTPGEIDEWTFEANIGDAIALSIGEVLPAGPDPDFRPWIRLVSPGGAQLASTDGYLTARIGILSAPLTGTYTVRVASGQGALDNTGDYRLVLARTPGAFVVPAGDEGGAMTNGENHTGHIHVGDLDLWSFEANIGDAIALSIGEILPAGVPDPDYRPWIRLRSPSGEQLGNTDGYLTARINVLSAPLTGTYTVIVGTGQGGYDNEGDYRLILALTPGTFVVPDGDEGGAMANGANHTGHIDVGDIDIWSFTANIGDAISLSIGEVLPTGLPDPDFRPWIRLRSPSGQQLGNTDGYLTARINVPTAPLTGTYTVIVGTGQGGYDNTGDYRLVLARTPGTFIVPDGDEGGPMLNGTAHPGTLPPGDLDLWTFCASQGASLSLTMAEILPQGVPDPGFNPWIRLLAPSGQQVGSSSSTLTAQINTVATATGLYTVLSSAGQGGYAAAGMYQVMVSGAVGCPVPTTLDDAYFTLVDTPLAIPAPGVLGNDNSNGGGSMTAELLTTVSSGSLTLNADGSLLYTPPTGATGVTSFTYRAVNAFGAGNVATVTIAVDTTAPGPQPPIGLYASLIAGNTVTLRWTPPVSGTPPTGYVLEGGVNPGEMLASIPMGTDPIYTFPAPTGAFYVRVHTLSGATRSVASNEIRIFVNQPAAPSAPADLVGLVNGSSIALAWRNTFAGGAPGGIVLDVSGALTTSLPLGLTDSFQFNGVPGGTYTLSLRATNSVGSSPSSNAITLTFPTPCTGAPLPPSRFLAYRLGRTLFVVWDPATSGPAPTSYVLNVTGAFSGSFGTPGRTLSGAVGPGAYHLSVTAANACGSSAATPVQTVVVP